MGWELTLSSKGQLTIPKDLREAVDMHPGDQVVLTVLDGTLVMTPKNVDFADLAGLLGVPPKGAATLEEIDAAVLRAAGANVIDIDDDHCGGEADAAE
jgi:AbrB family looped-hinge helix DNA binding protein